MAEKVEKALSVREKFEVTARELGEAMVERDTEIELLMTALIGDEHVLLIGPPGTGKSLLLDSLVAWMSCNRFSVLLTGQSTLGDIYGPVSLAGLKNDKHIRATAGMLPEAHAAFVDEIFKGNSSVRNGMLRAINERQFSFGDGTFKKIPLQICLGASNEWPRIEDDADAIFDRFLFRKEVQRVTSSKGLSDLVFGGDHKPKLSTSLSLDELNEAREEAAKVAWSNEAKEALMSIVFDLHKEGIFPSERRLVKAEKVCKAVAWLEGASAVDTEHLAILAHVLWTDPAKELRTKAATVVLKHANPSAARIQSRLEEADQIIKGVKEGDLMSAQTATSKLTEIVKKLKVEKSAKAKAAVDRLTAEIKRIKIGAVAAATGS